MAGTRRLIELNCLEWSAGGKLQGRQLGVLLSWCSLTLINSILPGEEDEEEEEEEEKEEEEETSQFRLIRMCWMMVAWQRRLISC